MSADTKHSSVEHVPLVSSSDATDAPEDTLFEAVELNPPPITAAVIDTSVQLDVKEDGPADYAELSLHLNAPDKFGVAFQLGGLLALQSLGLLDHVRFMHAGGYSNFIVAQFILAVYARAGYPSDGSVFEYTTGWKPVLTDLRTYVIDPILDHLLMKDQESIVFRRRVFRPWKWRLSWNHGFEEWFRDDWPHANRMEDALQFVATHRHQTKTVPVFTLNCADSLGGSAMTTDKEPPMRMLHEGDEDIPGNVTDFAAASTVVKPRLYLMASVFGGRFVGSSLTGVLPMDPLILYPYETYFMAQRGTQRRSLQNDRCIVLDAFSRSYSDRKGGVVQKAYAESQVIKITETPVLPVVDDRPNERVYTSVPALYRHGYVRMHPRVRELDRTLDALVTARTTPTSMLAMEDLTAKQLVNWGYVSTMKQFEKPVSRSDHLPFPFHNDPMFEIAQTAAIVERVLTTRLDSGPEPADL